MKRQVKRAKPTGVRIDPSRVVDDFYRRFPHTMARLAEAERVDQAAK